MFDFIKNLVTKSTCEKDLFGLNYYYTQQSAQIKQLQKQVMELTQQNQIQLDQIQRLSSQQNESQNHFKIKILLSIIVIYIIVSVILFIAKKFLKKGKEKIYLEGSFNKKYSFEFFKDFSCIIKSDQTNFMRAKKFKTKSRKVQIDIDLGYNQ